MKRIICLLAAVIWVFQSSALCSAAEMATGSGASAAEQVLTYCKQECLVRQEEDGAGLLTRGEALDLLYRLQEYPLSLEPGDSGYENPFQDLDGTSPYYAAAISLYDKGIYAGIRDEAGRLFAMPALQVAREDAITMLARVLMLKSLNQYSYRRFPDAEMISAYASKSVSACVDLELLHGYEDGSFRPKEPMTKLEFLSLIYQAKILGTHTTERKPADGTYLHSTFDAFLFYPELELQVRYDSKTHSLQRTVINHSEDLYWFNDTQLEAYGENGWIVVPLKPQGKPQVLEGVSPGKERTFSTSMTSYDYTFVPGRYRLIQGMDKAILEEESEEPKYASYGPFEGPAQSPYTYAALEFDLWSESE